MCIMLLIFRVEINSSTIHAIFSLLSSTTNLLVIRLNGYTHVRKKTLEHTEKQATNNEKYSS